MAVIRPAKRTGTPIVATVEDPYHQAGDKTPVAALGAQPLTARGVPWPETNLDHWFRPGAAPDPFACEYESGGVVCGYLESALTGHRSGTNPYLPKRTHPFPVTPPDPAKDVPPGTALCKCGMARQGQPHLCIRWNAKMTTAEAKKDFTEVVKKHGINVGAERLVEVDMNARETIAFLRSLISPVPNNQMHLVLISDEAIRSLSPLRDDDGNRITLKVEPPYTASTGLNLLLDNLVVTREEDPDWVKSFTAKNTPRMSAMPVCCPTPDPRIAKNGRPYCHSCKKYLDKVPPPQLPRPVGEAK